MRNIVHVNFSFTIGGIDLMLINILNEQRKFANVTLIIVNDNYHSELLSKIHKSVHIILIKRKEQSYNIWKIILFNWILLKLNPDIIHCHNSNLINIILLRHFRIVLTVHDVGYSSKDYHKFDFLFAISQSVKLDVMQRSNLKPMVIVNGVNPNGIKTKVHAMLADNRPFRIVVISRLEHLKKGQHIVIEAISSYFRSSFFNDSKVEIVVDFIGEGKSESFLKELTEARRLSSSVRFLKSKDNDFVRKHLCEYDLLIQPSLYEGFGLTIVEAMMAKVPVLSSNIDGPSEILDKGVYGFQFKVGDAQDLLNGILKIMQHYKSANDFLNQIVERSYNRAIENYSIEMTARNYFENYWS